MKYLVCFGLIMINLFARDFSPSIELAKKMLDSSIINVKRTELDLEEDFKLIREAFNNEFMFNFIRRTKDGDDCYASVYKENYYLAQKSKVKTNFINICKSGKKSSDEIMAQNLIHEVSHAVLLTHEGEAIKFELLAAHFYGLSPMSNGNIRPIIGKKYLLLSKEELEFLDYAWKIELGLTGKDEWFKFALMSYSGIAELDLFKKLVSLKKFSHIDIKNFSDSYGYTPLMIAAREGYLGHVKYLVKKGVNVAKVNFDGYSAIDFARQYNRRKVLKFLLKNNL